MKNATLSNNESSHLLNKRPANYGSQLRDEEQNSNPAHNPFDTLPAETVAHIINFLEWKNVLLFRQADKRTNAITLDTPLENISDLREGLEIHHDDEEQNESSEEDNASLDETVDTKKTVADLLALLRAHQATSQEIMAKRKAAAASEWLLDTFQSRHPHEDGHILCWLLLPALACGGLGYAFYGTIPMTGCFTLMGAVGGSVGLGTSHHCLFANREHAREAMILEKNMLDDIYDQLIPKSINMGK